MSNSPDPSNNPGAIKVAGITIPAAEVQLIAAESGLSFSGGEMMIWKRNVVVTASRRFVSSQTPNVNSLHFHAWLADCPRAVGILPDGSVKLPRVDPQAHEDPFELLSNALQAVRRELGRQIIKTLTFAAAILIAGIAIGAFVIWGNIAAAAAHRDPAGYKIAVISIVFIVAAFLLAGRGFSLLARRNRIVNVLNGMINKGELQADVLASTLAPTPVTKSEVSLIPATLATLALTLMVCPFVGLLVSIIAYAVTFRKPSRARTHAIIGMIVGALSSAFACFMTLR